MAEQMGAGAALFDYDNDGDLDVFLVQRGQLSLKALRRGRTGAVQPAVPQRPDRRRERQAHAPLHRRDRPRRRRAARSYGMGAAIGDYDNDG